MYRNSSVPLNDTIDQLKKSLPTGAPVVLLPSVRAHDWTEVVRGIVLPLGLASSRLGTDWLGDFTGDDRPSIYVFEGTLANRHQTAFLPLLENAAREGGALLIAAENFDHQMMSLLVVNHMRSTVRVCALMPPPGAGKVALEQLAKVASATMGRATESLEFGQGGTVPRMFATLDQLVLIGDFDSAATSPLGLVLVGGSDLAHARARAREARL